MPPAMALARSLSTDVAGVSVNAVGRDESIRARGLGALSLGP